MKVFYVDVYFLFNLSIDLLALYFAASVTHVKTSVRRLLLGGILGGGFAVLCVFITRHRLLVVLSSVIMIFLLEGVACGRKNKGRRLVFAFYYLLFDLLLGGLTYLVYQWFLSIPALSELTVAYPESNIKFILASIIILLGIGIIKVGRKCISDTVSQMTTVVRIRFFDKEIETVALVDTGNLLSDPLTGTPVMLIKNSDLFLPDGTDEGGAALPAKIKKRMRLIPYKNVNGTGLLTAWKPDTVTVLRGRKSTDIEILIAQDKEGGTFGGYESLIPYAALRYV